MSTAALPPLDEHTTTIAADPDEVWSALLDTVDGAFLRPGATLYARLVGCAPATTSGSRPLGEGATVPGFRVVVAAPSRLLVLEGHHRFSSYALSFGLQHGGAGSTVLRAESRARAFRASLAVPIDCSSWAAARTWSRCRVCCPRSAVEPKSVHGGTRLGGGVTPRPVEPAAMRSSRAPDAVAPYGEAGGEGGAAMTTENVTVLFTDMVGSTALASSLAAGRGG